MTVLSPEVLQRIATSVREAPPLTREQAHRLRTIWCRPQPACRPRPVRPRPARTTEDGGR